MYKLDTILLIDDDFTTNYLHKKIISKSEIDSAVEVANNGKEGIDKLVALNETIHDKNALVLLFLDLNMPIMDGWHFLEVFEEIKSTLNYKINLFIVSSSINPDDEERAKNNLHVLDYFPKPLTVDRLNKLKANYI
jgi:CheY-like chemotaxis protein